MKAEHWPLVLQDRVLEALHRSCFSGVVQVKAWLNSVQEWRKEEELKTVVINNLRNFVLQSTVNRAVPKLMKDQERILFLRWKNYHIYIDTVIQSERGKLIQKKRGEFMDSCPWVGERGWALVHKGRVWPPKHRECIPSNGMGSSRIIFIE